MQYKSKSASELTINGVGVIKPGQLFGSELVIENPNIEEVVAVAVPEPAPKKEEVKTEKE